MTTLSQVTSDLDAASRTAISVDHVSKVFPRGDGEEFIAVDDVSFDVAQGEIVALLGPSGSGKTTILNMVAALIAPDAGSIDLLGASGAGVDWSRVGYMFQDDRLLPWRVAVDNIALALEAAPMDRAEQRERSRAMLDLVGLASFANSYPHELSGGMRSRVALARSLVTRPDILLMDEPFGRLDAQTRSTMHEQLLEIHRARGLAILLVTHDVEEAVVLAQRIIVLSPRPGRIAQIVDVDLPRPRLGDAKTAAFVNDLRNVVSSVSLSGEQP